MIVHILIIMQHYKLFVDYSYHNYFVVDNKCKFKFSSFIFLLEQYITYVSFQYSEFKGKNIYNNSNTIVIIFSKLFE